MMTLKHHNNALFDSPILSNSFLKTFFIETDAERKSHFVPGADVLEHEGSFEIKMALPGYEKQSIQIDYKDGLLTIMGEHKTQDLAQTSKVLRKELNFEAFKRQYRFENILANEISAKFDNGLLSICLPKQTSISSNKIAIL